MNPAPGQGEHKSWAIHVDHPSATVPNVKFFNSVVIYVKTLYFRQGKYRYKKGTSAVLTEQVKKIDFEVVSQKVETMDTS